MSLDQDHIEKMKVLNELVKLQEESKRRDIIVLVASIAVNVAISLVIKFF